MYNKIVIGEKEVPMLSMASVDLYYRNIFHEDPIKLQTQGMEDADAINFIIRMGFVMAKFAELKDRKEMAKLNEDTFLDWLDQFERNEILAALPDVQKAYEGQMVTGAQAKKNNGEQTDE